MWSKQGKRIAPVLSLLASVLLMLTLSSAAWAQIGGAITGETYEAKYPQKAVKWQPAERGEINFEKDLYIEKDIMLQGLAGYKRIEFTIPRYWDVQDGSKVEILLSHSPTLIPDLSAVVFVLNGKVLYTHALDKTNTTSTTYALNLPKEILSDYNVLELIAHQHYMLECEDPFDPSLWTSVHRTSSIIINYKRKLPYIDLAYFPYPIYEKMSYGEAKIRLQVPELPSQSTLNAVGRYQAFFGRYLDYRRKVDYMVSTTAPDKVEHPMVLIGTPQENAAIKQFADLSEEKALPLPLITETGFSPKFTTPDGAQISGESGVIIFTHHPDAPELPILILSGNSPVGVAKAVAAITELPYEKSIAGQALVVRKVDPRPLLAERTKTTHIPLADDFTLEDINFKDVTVRGFWAPAIGIDIIMEPDAHPVMAKQKLKLVYSYGAQLQPQLSSLEVSLNGVSIESKNLNVSEGESHSELLVDLPVDLLQPYNRLMVKFFLFPDNYFICGRVSDRHLWASLHKETELTMPRHYYVYMPDLSLLKYELYPYTLHQDLQNTTLVVNDNPTSKDYRALAYIAAELGRLTQSEGIWLKTYQVSKLPAEVKANDHLIVLDSSVNSRMMQKLVGNTRLYYNDENERVMKTIEDGEMKTVEWKSGGFVEQINSPFNTDKTILLVRGQNEKQLKLAVATLVDSKKVNKLDYNLAFAYDTQDVKSVETVDKSLIGDLPSAEETQTWIYLNFWKTALLIIAAIILLYILISVVQYFRRRRRERIRGQR